MHNRGSYRIYIDKKNSAKIPMLLLVLLLTLCQAKWEAPIKAVPYFEIRPNVFTDNENGVSHIAYCDLSMVNYKRMYPNGTVSHLKIFFDWKYPCYYSPLIQGFHDGKNLFMVYSGSRTEKKVVPFKCHNDPINCRDVLFSESKDGGNTWSDAIQVPRSSLNDMVSRDRIHMLITPLKQLFVFYMSEGSSSDLVTFTMKKSESSPLNNELKLPIRDNEFMVTSSLVNGVQNITVTTLERFDKTQHYYYTNNGIRWYGPYLVEGFCKKSARKTVPYSSILAPSYAFSECLDSVSGGHFSIYNYNGKTLKLLKFPNKEIMNPLSITGDGKGNGFVSYAHKIGIYAMFTDDNFKTLGDMPVDEYCSIITSIYKSKNILYWYTVKNKDYTSALWVTKGTIENRESETE